MAFKNVNELKRTTKALFIGPTGAGKTYPGLQLEGPIGAYDGEDGLRAYRDAFDFFVDPFDSIEELNRKIREDFLGDPEAVAAFNTIMIDGLTVAWHEAIRKTEDQRGRIDITDQAKLKRPWKEFNELVFKLGKRNKNVWATVQAKAEWEIKPGQPPKLKGMKGDVADKIWYAFDIVCYIEVVDGIRTVSILKSRYPTHFQVGDTIEHFDLRNHFAPIFDGTADYVDEANAQAEEIARTQRVIETKLKALGSKAKGGVVPDEDARRIYRIATAGDAGAEDVATALDEVRKFEREATEGEAETAAG